MTPADKQELRELVRAHLAERPRLALNADDIRRPVSRKLECTVPEVADALSLLKSLGQVEEVVHPLGSIKHYRITATGTLAHERGE